MLAEDMPPTGRFDGREHRFPLRVYFEDTDLSGVVYHANYLRFLERARTDMLRLAGVDLRATWEAGIGTYVIRSAHVDYRAPARLDDVLIVVSHLTRVRRAAVDIHQRVMRSGTIVAEAMVEAAFVAPDGRVRRQPDHWIEAFTPLIGKES
jgi:acyl-CoA thioester hydrolase